MGAFPCVRTYPSLGGITSALIAKRWHQWIVFHEKRYFVVRGPNDLRDLRNCHQLDRACFGFPGCPLHGLGATQHGLQPAKIRSRFCFFYIVVLPGEHSRISCQLGGRNWCELGYKAVSAIVSCGFPGFPGTSWPRTKNMGLFYQSIRGLGPVVSESTKIGSQHSDILKRSVKKSFPFFF